MESVRTRFNDPGLQPFIRAVGQALLLERRKCGMSQQQVAELVGIEPESVSRIENGVIAPTLARLRQFAIIYSCSLEVIVAQASDQASDIAKKLAGELQDLPEADRTFVADQAILIARHIKSCRKQNN